MCCSDALGIVVALVQFVAGAYLSSYLAPVDAALRNIRDRIMELDDPKIALKYYGVIADSLAAVWRGMSLLTTARGRCRGYCCFSSSPFSLEGPNWIHAFVEWNPSCFLSSFFHCVPRCILHAFSGVFDTVAVVLWVYGWHKQKITLLYVFIGMMAFDFAIDFCLFFVFMAVINALYIAYFFPVSCSAALCAKPQTPNPSP